MIRKLITITIFSALLSASSLKLPAAFTSNFEQSITTPSKKTINYSGNVMFSSSTLLKWSYVAPAKKEVCTDSKIVLVVDHALEQISAFKISKGLNLPMVIKSAKNIRNNQFIASYDKRKYNITSNKNGQLLKISYIDELDNSVNINFISTKYLNKPINGSKLKCNYPSSYDIIEG